MGELGREKASLPLCERRAFSLIFTSIEYIEVVRLAAAEAIDLARNAPKVHRSDSSLEKEWQRVVYDQGFLQREGRAILTGAMDPK